MVQLPPMYGCEHDHERCAFPFWLLLLLLLLAAAGCCIHVMAWGCNVQKKHMMVQLAPRRGFPRMHPCEHDV